MTGGKISAISDDPIFLGRAVERLSILIEEQCEIVFRQHGVTIPVKSCSLVSVLAELGTATAADLSRALDVSHQLVLQKIPKLTKLGLITSAQDQDDARKRAFALTAEGQRQFAEFQHCRTLIQAAYHDLFEQVGDLFDLTLKTTTALGQRSLDERIAGRP